MKKANLINCCGNTLGVTIKKYLDLDQDVNNYFGSKVVYYVECPTCKKRTEEMQTSSEAIKKWKKVA